MHQSQEYFELYGVYYEAIKKHKVVKKGTKGMDFGIYTSRILTLEEAEKGTKRFSKKQKQTQFQNKKGKMVMVTINKSEFGQLNDKRYVLPDRISSFPYKHLALSHIESFKETLFPLNAEKIITHHKYNLLRFEQGKLESNERLRIIKLL